jgi:hypothetical protein
MTRRSEQAVALVITLIMLSVITLVAVAFLAVARRDRSAVTNADDLSRAELMADAARERAIAEIAAQMLGRTNPLAFDLLVSVNVDTNTANPTALLLDPRAPVVVSNQFGFDDRSFLDLNRNGAAETNGPGVVGDPEWIGVTERFGAHGPNNRFIGRYAYLVLPAGKSLDLDFMHNETKQNPSYAERYYRGLGFGTWDLNLGGFLADLNTNVWPTTNFVPAPMGSAYRPDPNLDSPGRAYYDAAELLRYRYSPDYRSLPLSILPWAPDFALDVPSPLDLGADLNTATNWAGSDNPRRYFDPAELFLTARNPNYTNFVTRLRQAMAPTNSPYDRYTFYRLLAQLGMDSVPERDKIHLNYADPDPLQPVSWHSNAATRAAFFHTVATRLMQDTPSLNLVFTNAGVAFPLVQTGFPIRIYARSNGIEHLPLSLGYSPALHRLLQLSANLLDATTTNAPGLAAGPPFYPTVFRPVFSNDFANVYIHHYEEASQFNAGMVDTNNWFDLTDPNVNPSNIGPNNFVYGVPLIVGAKKGYPNFNEYVLLSAVEVERKIWLGKDPTRLLQPPSITNTWLRVAVSNAFGIEAWNSYADFYPRLGSGRAARMFLHHEMTTTVTNGSGLSVPRQQWARSWASAPIQDNGVGGWGPTNFSFTLFTNNVQVFTNAQHRSVPSPGLDSPFGAIKWETNIFSIPDWDLAVTNRLFYFLVETNGRVVDAVSLAGLGHSTNVARALTNDTTVVGASLWSNVRLGASNNLNALTLGHLVQTQMGSDDRFQGTDWNQYGVGQASNAVSGVAASSTYSQQKKQLITNFRALLNARPIEKWASEGIVTNGANPVSAEVPFTPTAKFYVTTRWQVNDPLVHHHLEDLRDVGLNFSVGTNVHPPTLDLPVTSVLGTVNERYRPWGGRRYNNLQLVNPTTTDSPALKDPMVRSSEDWDFPNSKFPNIGWLGRVHRGTPWQTVYLKSAVADPNDWLAQSVDWRTHPTNDWRLVDLFTVAQNTNASRGQLSINQTNRAAWSAVLSGVSVFSNGSVPDQTAIDAFQNWLLPPPLYTNLLIEPNSTNQLIPLVNAINSRRTALPRGTFDRLSELLAVPELTMASPFLNTTSPDQLKGGLTDEAYEQLPRRILSLLRVGEPRVVVYAYGQSLKPAPNSILTASVGNIPALTCTNYQVTGEAVTRTVVRYEAATNAANRLVLKPVIESFNVLPPE